MLKVKSRVMPIAQLHRYSQYFYLCTLYTAMYMQDCVNVIVMATRMTNPSCFIINQWCEGLDLHLPAYDNTSVALCLFKLFFPTLGRSRSYLYLYCQPFPVLSLSFAVVELFQKIPLRFRMDRADILP